MTDPEIGASRSTTDRRTITDFGDQWTRYTDNSGYYGSLELFADICGPLLRIEDIDGRIAADIGSGTGRIVNMLLDAGAAHVTAIEPSDSYQVVQANTRSRASRVSVIHGDGAAIPQDGNFDLVTSIGVLHHIEHPAPIIDAARRALKPGGVMLVWLYGREGNELYLALIEPLRLLTRRLPHKVLAGLCFALDFLGVGYAALCKVLPLPMRHYMTRVYGQLASDKRRLVIYDQLNPAYARYYRELDARALLKNGGFKNIRTHHRHGYSWSVIGVR